MKKNIVINGLVALAMLSCSSAVFAQDYDDIYYTPKAEKAKKAKKTTVTNYTPTPDYPAADTYSYSGYSLSPTNRDVDEYNRHGNYSNGDTMVVNADTLGEFLYTRRLERFHNPDVVTNTGDEELIDYYYSQPSASTVNIYVNSDPFYYGWGYPYYSSFYYPYSWRYYSPYYWNTWGPSWSFGWGWSSWDPWYNWGWGGPAYYPPRPPHPGHGPGWGNAWRPTSPGASRPHVAGAGTTPRPGSSGSYGGGIPSVNNRPGAMGTGRYTGTTTRPGNSGLGGGNSAVRPGTAGSYRPGNMGTAVTTTRPATSTSTGSSSSSTRGRSSSSSSYNGSSSSSTNRSSYNSGSYNSGRSSYSGGSGSSFGGSRSSGGSYSGGGGGGRGRR